MAGWLCLPVMLCLRGGSEVAWLVLLLALWNGPQYPHHRRFQQGTRSLAESPCRRRTLSGFFLPDDRFTLNDLDLWRPARPSIALIDSDRGIRLVQACSVHPNLDPVENAMQAWCRCDEFGEEGMGRTNAAWAASAQCVCVCSSSTMGSTGRCSGTNHAPWDPASIYRSHHSQPHRRQPASQPAKKRRSHAEDNTRMEPAGLAARRLRVE